MVYAAADWYCSGPLTIAIAINGMAEGLTHLQIIKRSVPGIKEQIEGDEVRPGNQLVLQFWIRHHFGHGSRGQVANQTDDQ